MSCQRSGMIPQNHLPDHKELSLQLHSLRRSSFSVALLKLLVILIRILWLVYSVCEELKYLCVMLALALDGLWWTMPLVHILFAKWNFGVERMLLCNSDHLCIRAWGASNQSASNTLLEDTFFCTLAQLSPPFPSCSLNLLFCTIFTNH